MFPLGRSFMHDSRLNFRIDAQATGTRARAATFRTLHNEVQTPVFMPVGTNATVKAQLPGSLEDAGSQILLANTYHLLLRPGPEVFRKMGGIHNFMSWKRSVLTDSGGFQIFSLPHSRLMSEEGATFQSYVDGRTILLTPELSIETQKAMGSDIMMVLDQCVPSTSDHATARAALELTNRWAARSLAARGDSPQSMFAIIQGALFRELRRESAARLGEMPFDGFAIGGLAVGEGRSEREDVCEYTAQLLDPRKPRYLMGVGTPLDILEAVHRGVDMFDCIIPTQVAQRGTAFTSLGPIQLRRGFYKFSGDPIDPGCPCPTCAKYSRAYLHHLTKTGETLGWQLIGDHNFHFYHRLMRGMRQAIIEDRFPAFYREKRTTLDQSDVETPMRKPPSAPRKAPALGAYEIHTIPGGSATLRHKGSGEIMHTQTPPFDEARRLYIDRSDLARRLRLATGENPTTAAPLILWDVGLGTATTAMAAIRTLEEEAASGAVRPLQIVSFENDLDPLKLALGHRDKFGHLRHSAPGSLIHRGHWQSRLNPGLGWRLLTGDFTETLSGTHAPPDLIFYDISSGTSSGLWNLATLRRLFTACQDRPAELFTSACSTAIRAALLGAGFHVARGLGAGTKVETTIALTPAALPGASRHRYEMLSHDWFTKWSHADSRFPPDICADGFESFEQSLRAHPQFRRV